MFLTICMHQFGWRSERWGNFLNFIQEEGVPRWGGGSNPGTNYTTLKTSPHIFAVCPCLVHLTLNSSISNVDISNFIMSWSLLIIKNEMCHFKRQNVSFSNTKKCPFQIQKFGILKKRNVSFSNTKNVSFSNTKRCSLQIRKSITFKYEKCLFFKYENVSF